MTRAEGVLNLYFNVRSTGTLLLGIAAAESRRTDPDKAHVRRDVYNKPGQHSNMSVPSNRAQGFNIQGR